MEKVTETENVDFKALRKKAGLTLEALGKLSGYSVAALNGLENNGAGSKRLRSSVYTLLMTSIQSLPMRAAMALADQTEGTEEDRRAVQDSISRQLTESSWRVSADQQKLYRVRALLSRIVEMIDSDEDTSFINEKFLYLDVDGNKGKDRADVIAVYGCLPAGWPQDREAAQRPVRTVRVPPGRFPEGAFGLEVRGDSMNAAQPIPILDGDIVVLVSPERREPKSGDIVAALIDGETALKRLINGDKPAHLKSESTDPAFKAIHPVRELIIQGVVVGKL